MAKSTLELLDEAMIDTKPVGKARVGTGAYVANAGLTGVLEAIGGVADAPARVWQLGKAAGSMALNTYAKGLPERKDFGFLERKDFGLLDVNIEAANRGTNALKKLFGVDESMVAPDETARYLGAAAQGAGGALASGGGAAIGGVGAGVKGLLANAAKNSAVGGVAGLGAAGGGDAMKAAGGPEWVGQVAGGLLGGVGAASFGTPAMAAYRLATQGPGAIAGAPGNLSGAADKARPLASRIINRQVEDAVSGTPNAAANIAEAQGLAAKIPGFVPSVAEMSGSPGLAGMQARYAKLTPKNLNEELGRVEANRLAVQSYYDRVAPAAGRADTVRATIERTLTAEQKAINDQLAKLGGSLPRADLVGQGDRMSQIAAAEKAAAQPGVTAAYRQAFDAAPDSVISTAPIVAKVEEILGQSLSQIKPESAPNTVRLLKSYLGGDKPAGMQAEMNSLANPTAAAGRNTLTLEQADALRKAVNADFAAAKASSDPMAATRLMNIKQLHGTIDDVVNGSSISSAAKGLYSGALAKYRTEFAPRFKEGVNKQMFTSTSLNEPRILADKFMSEYFKPDQMAGGTRAQNFTQLFGANAEAKSLTRQGILDRFRNDAVDPVTGALKSADAARFMDKYGRTLETFKSNGVNALDDIKALAAQAGKIEVSAQKLADVAKSLRYESIDKLSDAALGSEKVMGNIVSRLDRDGKDAFSRMLMDKALASGSSLDDFLSKNKETLKIAVRPGHLNDIQDVSKALEITGRSHMNAGAGSTGTDPLKKATGVSMATVWSQYRAVSGGRQGLVTMGFNLAAPVMTKLGQTNFDDIMKAALHDPKMAENLKNLLNAQTASGATASANALMRGLKNAAVVGKASAWPLTKVVFGGDSYLPNLKRTIPATNAVMQEQEQQ